MTPWTYCFLPRRSRVMKRESQGARAHLDVEVLLCLLNREPHDPIVRLGLTKAFAE